MERTSENNEHGNMRFDLIIDRNLVIV